MNLFNYSRLLYFDLTTRSHTHILAHIHFELKVITDNRTKKNNNEYYIHTICIFLNE